MTAIALPDRRIWVPPSLRGSLLDRFARMTSRRLVTLFSAPAAANAYDAYVASLAPLAWWKMQETSGNILNSGSLTGIDGVATGTPSYRDAGPSPNGAIPYAIGLNGSNEYFSCADVAGWDITDNLTVGIWAKSDISDIIGDDDALISKYNFDNNNREWILYLKATENLGCVTSVDGTTNADKYGIQIANSVSSINTWHFYCFTWSAGTCILYEDGGVKTSTEDPTFPNTIFNGTSPLRIGDSGGTTHLLWQGNLAQAFVFDKVLTAAQILNLYTKGIA